MGTSGEAPRGDAMTESAKNGLRRMSRRALIVRGAALSGGLLLTLQWPFAQARTAGGGAVPAGAPPRMPSAFLEIAPDESITVTTPAVEMGQGGHTAIPMILIDELGGDWSRVGVRDAPAAPVYDNPLSHQQATVGSFSVRGWYTEIRRIGAAAREMLVDAAAGTWGVAAADCTVANGVITHRPSGRTLSFGAVAARASALAVPRQPVLRYAPARHLVGTSPQRVDIPAKVDGSARYGIDMHLPGMLFAAIATSPTLGGRLRSYDASAAERAPGYRATVPLADGVIVVADSYWQACTALGLVKVQYDPGRLADLDSARVSKLLKQDLDAPGAIVRDDGAPDTAMAAAAATITADYEVPYLAHACMEPMNCTARVDRSGCEVWCGTQAPQGAQHAAAAAAGIAPGRVRVHTMYLGGGFGRRAESDYVAQAVRAAKAVGRPVKLIWSREEDIRHDFYRPAAAARFHAGLDHAGRLIAFDCRVVTSSKPTRIAAGPSFYTTGIADANYAIPNFRVTGRNADIGVRFGFWRSVNDSHNPYMLESFIDEVAHRAGKDPYLFRRALLAHPGGERQRAVLDLLAAKIGWQHPRPGRALGIAALGAFGSFVGSALEISVNDRLITLHRVVTAIDCGIAIHPDNIHAQLNGAAVFGLAAALRGEITLARGAVQQGNFNDYRVLALAETPHLESHIVASEAPPGGVGEPGTAPIAPALANALFAATGVRVRSLPLSKHGFRFVAERS